MIKQLAQLEGHYKKVAALTKDILKRLHDQEVDPAEVAACLQARERALKAAEGLIARLLKSKDFEVRLRGLSSSRRAQAEQKLASIRSQADQALARSLELGALINQKRTGLEKELVSLRQGQKLMTGYKGFKARVAYCLDRSA